MQCVVNSKDIEGHKFTCVYIYADFNIAHVFYLLVHGLECAPGRERFNRVYGQNDALVVLNLSHKLKVFYL